MICCSIVDLVVTFDVLRIRALPIVVIVVAMAWLPLSAKAQQTDTNAIFKAFQDSYARGNYPAAEVEAQKYAEAVKAQFGTSHAAYAAALHNLALVFQVQRKYVEAEGLYRRAPAIREQALGASHPTPQHD